MSGKTSVAILYEYCAKMKLPLPEFNFENENGAFVCQIMLQDHVAEGEGRSKRIAKHNGATALLRKIIQVNSDGIELDVNLEQPLLLPTSDVIVALRDFCVRNNHPLPTFEVVQQGGTPDSPEFITVSNIATIKRYGLSSKKKEAKQLAALQMLKTISIEPPNSNLTVANIDDDNNAEFHRQQKFKTYRELMDLKGTTKYGIKSADRHRYFSKFFDHLKIAAFDIIEKKYDSVEKKYSDLLAALKIHPEIKENQAEKNSEPLLFITFDTEFDIAFAGRGPTIYEDIIEYIKDMLV